MQQLRDATKKLAQRDAGAKPNDPAVPNPPALSINGKVEKVEGALVQLSVGTDHGIQENHTLYLYRLKPEKRFLGVVRVLDARPHGSVARVLGGNESSKVEVGDLVTSKAVKGDAQKPKDVEKPANPPANPVNGVIEKVDAKDQMLVSISIGADAGLKKNQTLEVYRLTPSPMYLGRITIVEMTPHKAVGRRVDKIGGALKVGDKVASSLTASDR